MTRAALGAFCLASCTRAVSPDPSAAATSVAAAASPEETPRSCDPPGECDFRAGEKCGAGDLPRLTEHEWSRADVEAMVAVAASRTVAVDRTGDKVRIVPGCRLDGGYTEVEGEPGSGRFRATNRVVFAPAELGAGCDTATHVVGAFVELKERFAAILVPLPCPPSTSQGKASGCVGRGLTGAQRRARSEEMMRREDPNALEASYVLDVYALWPEERRALSYSGDVGVKRSFDCFVRGQLEFPLFRSPGMERPGFTSDVKQEDCTHFPPFLTCFPGLFDPAPGKVSCWNEAPR